MQKKRIIVIVLLLLVFVSVVVAISIMQNKGKNNKTSETVLKQQPIDSGDLPTITVDTVTGNPGDEVQITAKIKNNPGILGMILTVYYDDSKCTLTSVESGDALKDVLDFTASGKLENGARFVWDGVEIAEDKIKDGNILIMNFRINKNAVGNCPITLKYFDNDIVDNNISGIYPQIKNGAINIITD